MKKLLRAITVSVCLSIIILDSKTAAEGIRQGIDICQQTVIPALFPFLVLCGMLTSELDTLQHPMLRKLCALLHIPHGTAPFLFTGLLGGYPAGARAIDQAYRNGQLSRRTAERMLPICNQCGPAFLFGMVGRLFSHPLACWSLWGIQLLSLLYTAQLLPQTVDAVGGRTKLHGIPLMTAMKDAVRAMADICSWVIFFRMCIGFLDKWIVWMFPKSIQIGIIGILELSNGCLRMTGLQTEALRYVLCAGILSFGGVCVTMQTFSVISPSLDKKPYILGKALQTAISTLIALVSCLTRTRPYLALAAVLPLMGIILMKKVRIGSRFSERINV